MQVLRESDLWGGRLWQHASFLKLWAGETTALFGAQMTDLALPTVAILSLQATALQIGLLEALQLAAYPFLAVFAGVYADRARRRPIMIASNTARCAILILVAVGTALHALPLVGLYAAAVALSVCRVFFDVTYQAYIPSVVSRENIFEANAKLQLSNSAAQIAGGPLAGVLVQLCGAAVAIGVNAAAFLVSVLSIGSVAEPEPPAAHAAGRSFAEDIREGALAIWERRSILFLTLCTATMNLGSSIVTPLYLVFLYRQLHLSPAAAGALGAFAGLGFLAGAAVAKSALRGLGLRRTLLVSAACTGVGYLILPAAVLGFPYATVALAVFTWSAISTVYNVNQVSFRQAMIPERLQGRVGATMRTFVWGVIPVGNLAGGVLPTYVGVVGSLVVAGTIVVAGTAWLALADMPHAVTDLAQAK